MPSYPIEEERKKDPLVSFVIFIVILTTVVIVAVTAYFSKTYIPVDSQKYFISSEQPNEMVLKNRFGHHITIQKASDHSTLLIDGQEFRVVPDQQSDQYTVYYPDGKEQTLVRKYGMLLPLDEHGEVSLENAFVVRVEGNVSRQQKRESYSPSTLAQLAYERNFYIQGNPGFLILAIFALINGWCLFNFEKYQRVLFFISLKSIWTNDHEPSDFYFFMAKLSGVFSFASGVILFFASFI